MEGKAMKHSSSYLKMRVLGAIDYAEGKTIRERIQKASELKFTDEDGNIRQFTWRTISTWFYRYKNYGITGVQSIKRSDKGKTRKVSPEELLEAINQILPYFRTKKRYNKSDIFRKCIEKGILRRDLIGPTSFYRFIREYDLLNDKDISQNKRRLAFSMQYANQLWQADTMFGPYVTDNKGKMIQTKLIAFLDDASRVICHGQFFFHENTDSLVIALKNAFYKRGIPEQMYVDQGSIYTSVEITLICARIGCILRHAPLRDAAAKGKIERFFRTVRGKFLNRNLDLSSLDILNKQFTSWVEDEYNATVHSSISMKPVDRFAIDLKRIKFLAPNEISDELFYAEDTRKVKKDNTFSFDNIRYEAPVHLRDRQIHIRFDRHRRNRIVVYYKGNRMGEAKKLNPVANAKLRNKEIR
jgi:transposase InsO family protein